MAYLLKLWALGVLCLLAGCVGDTAATRRPAPSGEDRLRAVAILPADARSLKNGMELARDTVNAAGGVMGRPLEITFIEPEAADTYGDAALAAALREAPSVLWIAGDYAARQAPRLREADVLSAFLTPYPPVPGLCPLGVRIYSNGAQTAQAAFDLAHTTGIANVVILNREGDVNGAMADYLAYLMKGDGIRVYRDVFSKGETDFRLMAEHLKRLKPDAVYLVGAAAELEPAARALQSGGLAATLVAPYHSSFPPDPAHCPALAAALVYPRPTDRLSPDFTRAYAQRFFAAPDRDAAYGYENVARIAAAANRARSRAPAAIRAELFKERGAFAVANLAFEPDGDTRVPLRRHVPDGVVLPPPQAPHALLQPVNAVRPATPDAAPL